MSDETDCMSALDGDFSNTETGFPLLVEGLYKLRVVEMSTKPQKSPKTGHNLHIKFALVEPGQDTKGNVINPGFPVLDLISLVKTERYDPKPQLARFMEAAKGDKSGAFNPLEQWIGAEVTVRLAIEKSEEYGDKNRIKLYIKKG